MDQICTKTLLHEGSNMHEETLLHGGSFFHECKNKKKTRLEKIKGKLIK